MLEKLTLRYDPAEDRLGLALHVTGDAGPERRLLQLTRRTSVDWRADMAAMLRLAESEPQSAFAAQAAPVQRARSTGQATAPAASEPSSPPALGAIDTNTPVLVSRVRCARRRSDGRWLLKFQLRGRPTVSLTLSDKALQDLMAALQRQLALADWSLPPLEASNAPPQAQRNRSLH
jgi:hypothetical protein